MKITEISVWKDRKIQVAQYEPYGFGYGMKAEVKEGENIKECYEQLEKWVDDKILYETMKWKNPQKLVQQEFNTKRNTIPEDVKSF